MPQQQLRHHGLRPILGQSVPAGYGELAEEHRTGIALDILHTYIIDIEDYVGTSMFVILSIPIYMGILSVR